MGAYAQTELGHGTRHALKGFINWLAVCVCVCVQVRISVGWKPRQPTTLRRRNLWFILRLRPPSNGGLVDVSLSLFCLKSSSVHCSRYIPTHYKCLSSEFITATNMFVLHFGYQLITQGAMNIISCTCHFPKTKEVGNEHYPTQNMCLRPDMQYC